MHVILWLRFRDPTCKTKPQLCICVPFWPSVPPLSWRLESVKWYFPIPMHCSCLHSLLFHVHCFLRHYMLRYCLSFSIIVLCVFTSCFSIVFHFQLLYWVFWHHVLFSISNKCTLYIYFIIIFIIWFIILFYSN